MKTRWLWFVVLLWTAGAAVAEISGEEVLRRSADAYATLTAYTGTTTVNSKSQFDGRELVRKATAQITFTRPDKIHITGQDASGHAFAIISDGPNTWSSWAIQNQGAFERAKSVE